MFAITNILLKNSFPPALVYLSSSLCKKKQKEKQKENKTKTEPFSALHKRGIFDCSLEVLFCVFFPSCLTIILILYHYIDIIIDHLYYI